MTKLQFWPADYFSGVVQTLVLSEPVAGQVRVTWQPTRGQDHVDLYARTHATNWPTLDGTSGGILDPQYKINSFKVLPPAAVSDYTLQAETCVWTNTGYSNGNIVRAIAVPMGQFGYTNSRIFNSFTMQNAIGPALIRSGSTFLDDGLGDGLSGAGLAGAQVTCLCGLSRTSAVSNSSHDIQVEVMDRTGGWNGNYTKRYMVVGDFNEHTTSLGALIDPAADVTSINMFMADYLNVYPQTLNGQTHLAIAIKLVPSGGGTPVDMLVYNFRWNVQ